MQKIISLFNIEFDVQNDNKNELIVEFSFNYRYNCAKNHFKSINTFFGKLKKKVSNLFESISRKRVLNQLLIESVI